MNAGNFIRNQGAFLVVMVTAIALLGLSCDRSESPTEGSIAVSGAAGGPVVEVSAEIVSHTGCKGYDTDFLTEDIFTSQSAVSWVYDGNGTLDITHINAGFNCCPESLSCEISVEDRTITFKEEEFFGEGGGCACLCLFDVVYRVTGLPPGKYQIIFEEPYVDADDNLLDFSATMKGSGSSGLYVVDRCVYPWSACEPTGALLGCEVVESCCTEGTGCLMWEYSGGFLLLTHRNMYGSCCIVSDPGVQFDFTSNAISITEDVMMGPLTIMTCVQFRMIVIDLPPAEYHVTLNRFMDLTPMEITLDLINEPSGEISFD